jgi:hypothetical protein
MSWRDRLTQSDWAASANDNSVKSAISSPKRAFGTNGTIGNAEHPKKSAAGLAVPKPDDDPHWNLAESTPTGCAGERVADSDSGGRTDDQHVSGTALVKYAAGDPKGWAQGFAQLDRDRPPGDVPPARWRVFIEDVGRFLGSDFAGAAAALAWTPHHLFGCDRDRPFARIDQAGLLWLLNGERLIALSENTATIATKTGTRQTYRCKRSGPGQVLPWEQNPEPFAAC